MFRHAFDTHTPRALNDTTEGPSLKGDGATDTAVSFHERSVPARFWRSVIAADVADYYATNETAHARLKMPLPRAQYAAAVMQFALNGVVLSGMLASIVAAAVAIVVMPLRMGREGVGLSMISMFGVCVTALLSTIPYFATRGAARLLRGDARGIPPVRRVAWVACLLSAAVAAISAYTLGYFGGERVPYGPIAMQLLFVIAIGVFVLEIATLSIVRMPKT